jgi:hypothetical protein
MVTNKVEPLETVEIMRNEYEKIMRMLEEAVEKKKKATEKRNEWTYKYVNKPENIEKIKEKRREYARKEYEKNKNDEEYMRKKRENALTNYYKKKHEKSI